MRGRFRNCGRGISTGTEELTQPGGEEAVIRTVSSGGSTPEPELKDWMIESKTDSIQGSPGLRSHQGATEKCPELGVEGARAGLGREGLPLAQEVRRNQAHPQPPASTGGCVNKGWENLRGGSSRQ